MSAATMSAYHTAADVTGEPPRVVGQLEAGMMIPEGEPFHLDLQVSSSADVNIDWYKDDQKLNAGSRLNTAYDRGYAALDVLYTYPGDTGMYYCRITNRFGEVQADPVLVTVVPEQMLQNDLIDAQFSGMDMAEHVDKHTNERDQRNQCTAAPSFTQQIAISNPQVAEGAPVRLLGYLAPVNDATLQVEWLKDGNAIGTGSRFTTFMDRGLVTLDIAYCFQEDSGQYSCRATNAMGVIESQSVNLNCEGAAKIETRSNLTENSINHLKLLEDPGEQYTDAYHEAVTPIPPTFKSPLRPTQLTVPEENDALFEIDADVGNGDRITVEWRHNGELVHTGSRINGKLEQGIATLSFKYTMPTDSGSYTCHITTEHGQAESQPAELICEVTGTIIAASQLPGDRAKGLSAIETLEANLNAPRGGEAVEDEPAAQPQILAQPAPVGEVEEYASVQFQIQFEPTTDATVKVEWYKDEDALSNGTRFRVESERGFASLTLLHTISQDSGAYWCRVSNAAGHADSERRDVLCNAGASIITQSNLLEGSEVYKLLQQMDNGDYGDATTLRYSEEDEPDSPPMMDVPPNNAEIIVGGPVRFLVRISGKPTPQILWTLDGEEIVQDSITKVYGDGPIGYLEIGRCATSLGNHQVRVIAQNPLGQVDATADLIVHPVDYKLPDLKHVAPGNPFKKLATLKKVECTPELNKALTKAKPSAETIMKMERGTEYKARSFRSPEVVAAEELFDKMALGLRKSEQKKLHVEQPPPQEVQ